MVEGWQGSTGREDDDLQPGDRVVIDDARRGRVHRRGEFWQTTPVLMDDTRKVEEISNLRIRKA